MEHTTWEHRSSLIRGIVERADCDVVCFQEVSEVSYATDFTFMAELGYDEAEVRS